MKPKAPSTVATITCDDCGKCCSGQAYLPLAGNMIDNDYRREFGWPIISLPAVLQNELERGLAANPRFEGTCVWFDPKTKRCRHYEWRPSTCRNFELGSEDCLRIRSAPGAIPGADSPSGADRLTGVACGL